MARAISITLAQLIQAQSVDPYVEDNVGRRIRGVDLREIVVLHEDGLTSRQEAPNPLEIATQLTRDDLGRVG